MLSGLSILSNNSESIQTLSGVENVPAKPYSNLECMEKTLVYISSYEVVSVFYIVHLALTSISNFLSFPSGPAPTLLLTPDDRLTLPGSLTGWPTITERVWSVYVRASGGMAPLEHSESIAHKGSPHKLIYCILLYMVL